MNSCVTASVDRLVNAQPICEDGRGLCMGSSGDSIERVRDYVDRVVDGGHDRVRWNGKDGVSRLADRPIKPRFHLSSGSLHAIQFKQRS